MRKEPQAEGYPKFLKEYGKLNQLRMLASLLGIELKPQEDPEEMSPDKLREYSEGSKFVYLLGVRRNYKWPWGAGAEYLYRELIHTLQLEHREDDLLDFAKSKPGCKPKLLLALRVLRLKAEGKKVREIQTILEAEGQSLSKEAVESYLKTRRKRRNPWG